MEGTIANYRLSVHTQNHKQMVILVNGVDNRDKAAKLIGKKVMWTSPAGKQINGEIMSAHGNSGALKVAFEIGLPGQALSTKVKIE